MTRIKQIYMGFKILTAIIRNICVISVLILEHGKHGFDRLTRRAEFLIPETTKWFNVKSPVCNAGYDKSPTQ